MVASSGANQSGIHSNGRLLALLTNVRLGWKWMEAAHTLAYQDTETIMAVINYVL